MATVVNNAGAERVRERSTGAGWVLAIIALLAIVLLFLLAGAFANRDTGAGANINLPDSVNVEVPGTNGAVQ